MPFLSFLVIDKMKVLPVIGTVNLGEEQVLARREMHLGCQTENYDPGGRSRLETEKKRLATDVQAGIAYMFFYLNPNMLVPIHYQQRLQTMDI